MKLKEVSDFLDGHLTGSPETEIEGVSGITDASEGCITYLRDESLLAGARNCRASAVISARQHPDLGKPEILVPNPSVAFARLLKLFYEKPFQHLGVLEGANVSADVTLGEAIAIYPGVYIGRGTKIGERVAIHPNTYVGEEAEIGDDCLIYPNVTIRNGVKIGKRVIIHSGVVIGSDGFGYVMDEGRHFKIPQVGIVIVGDDVEIGANSTVDRATTGATVIGAGTKIDNLVQIAHNVKIGKNVIIVAQTAIAGSSEIGDYVMIGGQAGISDHVKIQSGTMIAAQSGVMTDLQKDIYWGSPCLPHRQYKRSILLFKRLPELNNRIIELENKLKTLTGNK